MKKLYQLDCMYVCIYLSLSIYIFILFIYAYIYIIYIYSLYLKRIFSLYHFELLLLQNAEAIASLEVFYKIGLLKHFTKFTGEYLCRNLFLNKVSAWRLATLLKQKYGTVATFKNTLNYRFIIKGGVTESRF